MNKYPVLFITLKDVEDLNFEQAYEQLVNTISDLCIEHDYLRNSDKEHGNGRPDVIVKDYKNRRVIIIEAKISSKDSRV